MIHHTGAYGIVVEKGALLLTVKQKGPYKGLLDLPGGRIEAGETPEEALRREFLEEVAMRYRESRFIKHVFHTQADFQHEGFLFHVAGCTELPQYQPEELFDWYLLEELDPKLLTPFAKLALVPHQ